MKKLLSMLLVLTFMLSCGCAFADGYWDKEAEPVKLTYWCPLSSFAAVGIDNLKDNLIYKTVMETSNFTIEFIHPAIGEEKTAFNLLMMSNELPDIIEYNWTHYEGGAQKALDDDIIIPLNDVLADYAPDAYGLMTKSDDLRKQCTTDDGTFYAFIPIVNSSCIPNGMKDDRIQSGPILRKDWMEELNLTAPVTIEDWTAVLTAFKDQKGAEAPLCAIMNRDNVPDVFEFFLGAYGVGYKYYLNDDKVMYGPAQEGYRNFLRQMKMWYDTGLLDADFASNNADTRTSNILNGRSGAYVAPAGSGIQAINQMGKAADESFQLYGVDYPVIEAGQTVFFAPYTYSARSAGQAAITRSCRDVEAACKFLNFWYTDEGSLLKNFGVEELCYIVNEDGTLSYTDLINNNPDGLTQKQAKAIYMRTDNPNPGPIVKTYTGDVEADIALDMWCTHADDVLTTTYPSGASMTSDEAFELASLNANIDAYTSEMAIKFIMGTVDLEIEWDTYVSHLKTLGVERIIELKQAAADRYNNK
ncbi:MAG: extracellular solute-binding protein [Christensenellales bacterium]|jgi:putative aldouronate transport system substrate-binding protein